MGWKTLVLLPLLLLTACANSSGAVEPKQEATIALPQDIITLDPLDTLDAPSITVENALFETLVRRDDTGEIVPSLALSWSTSPDGLTWTFQLQKGVKFHDGSDFTASVVKWQFDRVLFDPDAPVRFRKQWQDVLESVEAPASDQIVFHLRSPNVAFMELVLLSNAGFITSKENFDRRGAKEAALHPVGTGPFIFESWTPGQEVVLKKNPDYWGEKAKLDTLIFRPISEANTQVIELETGGIHMATKLNAEDVGRLQSQAQIEILLTPAYRTRYLRLNGTNQLLSDLRLRQAMNYAIDGPTLVASLVGQLGVYNPAAILPRSSWAYPEEVTAYPYDPQKARALLEEAGWMLHDQGVREKDGQPLAITFLAPSGRYAADKEISEAVKKYLEDVGFQVDVKVLEWATFLEEYRARRFDLVLIGTDQESPEPALFLNPLVQTGGRLNYSDYSDTLVDSWLEAALNTSNRDERKELYKRVLSRVEELAWFIPLYDEVKVAALSSQLKGYRHNPATTRFDTLYIGR
ncbi:MAG: ABC transporter substrate-binding protein [Bacillota bacterium]|nr:ABC transporter substrate-binding protein [Bacillota bacterium]